MNHSIVMKRPGIAAVLALLFGLGLANSPATGQDSDADLRRENQELNTRVEDLTTELEAAQRQIDRLEEQIMRNAVKESLDVEIEHPVLLPATPTRLSQRIMG